MFFFFDYSVQSSYFILNLILLSLSMRLQVSKSTPHECVPTSVRLARSVAWRKSRWLDVRGSEEVKEM